jgi:hypothetical protein
MEVAMKVSARVAKSSRVMSAIALIGAVVYLAMEVLVFVDPDLMNAIDIMEMHHTGGKITNAVPLIFRLAALAVELIPTSLVVWALLELHRLFRLYAASEVFSQAALRHLSRVATLMFCFVPISFVAEFPVTAALTWARGAGHREISMTLTSTDISFLFMAGVVLVIARVMAEARNMADENASFV